jgi:hypothetical protein
MEINSAHLLTQVVKAVAAAAISARSVDDVVSDLRFLRFNDDGVLALIDSTLNGDNLQPKCIEEALSDFNDHEWKVADVAARLLDRCQKVSNITRGELELIHWRKPQVRRDVQQALNAFGQKNFKIDVERLKRIRSSIVDLNRAIDEAEHTLLHGRRS